MFTTIHVFSDVRPHGGPLEGAGRNSPLYTRTLKQQQLHGIQCEFILMRRVFFKIKIFEVPVVQTKSELFKRNKL